MNAIRRGRGKPLLLIHGLAGSWRSWSPVLDALAAAREVIAVDLPCKTSVGALADEVARFIEAQGLRGVDAAGSSMGGRLVLELARRGGLLGAVVALDPGGFWQGWQRHFFYASLFLSVRLLRLLEPILPALTAAAAGRTLLLSQLSARPWRLSPEVMLGEMRGYAASPSFDELLWQLAYGEPQQGAPRGSIRHPLVIGWGRRDRVCFPSQARRALQLFPDARLHWFERCGHFPQWDAPQEAVRLILASTAGHRALTPINASGEPNESPGLQRTP